MNEKGMCSDCYCVPMGNREVSDEVRSLAYEASKLVADELISFQKDPDKWLVQKSLPSNNGA